MRARGVAIFLALALAVAATAGVYLYVRNVRKESQTKPTVAVVVSTQNIGASSALDPLIAQGIFTTKQFPSDTLVVGAITSLDQLRGQTTSSPILAGEQISTQRLGGGQLGGGILNIPPGFVAVTAQLDAPPNVAGFVRRGDHVQVYVTIKNKLTTLFPDVLVLSDSGASVQGQPAGTGGLVTLAFKPGDAQTFVLNNQNGQLWLALIPPGEQGQPFKPIKIKVAP